MLRRVVQAAIGLVLILLVAPLFLVIGASLLVSNGGAIIQRRRHTTRSGKQVTAYTFHTLNPDRHDDLIGRTLDRLQELPLLLNVIKGEATWNSEFFVRLFASSSNNSSPTIIAQLIVALAGILVPPASRSRCLEEWGALLIGLPGRCQLRYALSMLVHIKSICRELRSAYGTAESSE